jgi:hypothetical protein
MTGLRRRAPGRLKIRSRVELQLGDRGKRRYCEVKGFAAGAISDKLVLRPTAEVLDMGCGGQGAEFAEHERPIA